MSKNIEHVSENQFLTAKDVAIALNISIPFAYKLMRSNEIPTLRIGRSVRVRMEDLEEYITTSFSSLSHSDVQNE
jgi:excisionase family DNA binding protein